MISEDFSYYQQEVPGLFFMLGAKNEEKGFIHGLHSMNFNFDETILGNALDVYIKLLKYKNALV
jgi:N-acetyldiaminopimelate deacetylase